LHTLSLFNEVVFRYTTEQAIQEGHLVDYEAVKINSEVRVKGVFLKEGEHVGFIDTTTGEETFDQSGRTRSSTTSSKHSSRRSTTLSPLKFLLILSCALS
jgi:type I restriction enzyme R subunit